ncbi:MAG: hypothetical protein LVQ75_05320 [Candidatus Babeliales bacterium]|jgi:hypothetical protein
MKNLLLKFFLVFSSFGNIFCTVGLKDKARRDFSGKIIRNSEGTYTLGSSSRETMKFAVNQKKQQLQVQDPQGLRDLSNIKKALLVIQGQQRALPAVPAAVDENNNPYAGVKPPNQKNLYQSARRARQQEKRARLAAKLAAGQIPAPRVSFEPAQ